MDPGGRRVLRCKVNKHKKRRDQEASVPVHPASEPLALASGLQHERF